MITEKIVQLISSTEGIQKILSLVKTSGFFTNFRIFFPLMKSERNKLNFLIDSSQKQGAFVGRANLEIALNKLFNCDVVVLIEKGLIPEKKYELIDKDNIISVQEENGEKIREMLTKQMQDPINKFSETVSQTIFKRLEAGRKKALSTNDTESFDNVTKKRRLEALDIFITKIGLRWQDVEEYASNQKTKKIINTPPKS